MDHSSKEGASRENKRTARQDILAGNGNGGDSISIDTQVSHLTFKEVQSRCSGEGVLHRAAIGLSISLSPGPLDRRAPATVQQAKLYARLISHPPDQAVERINLPDQVSLSEPTYRRIAGHFADCRKLLRHKSCSCPHACSNGSGLAAGMATPNNNDIIRRHARSLERSRIEHVSRETISLCRSERR